MHEHTNITPLKPPQARPPNARTSAPSDSTRRRWARMAEVEASAREAAHADGLRAGYAQGWRWGLVFGLLASAGIVIAVWLVGAAR